MGDDHKVLVILMLLVAALALVINAAIWDYTVKQSILDQKLSIQCIEQGGTPLYINGHMSCLHKIARIA